MQITVRLFAALRLEAKTDAIPLELPRGATVSQALDSIHEEHPELRPWLARCRVAVGVDFADPDMVLRDGDTMSLIPPVQGGCEDDETARRIVVLTTEPLDRVLKTLLGDSPGRSETGGGAVVEFWGVVRGTENGAAISGIEYEAHAEMAEHQIHRILEDLENRLPLLREFVLHRIGLVPAGEASLYVRIEARHRREAFVACQSFIDQMKRDVPIWKHPMPES